MAGEPAKVDGAVLVPAEPADWHSVLAAGTRHRADRLADFNAADLAWQALIVRAPRRGADGYVGAIEIAAMAGFTRHRIYQIQGAGRTAGLFPPLEKKKPTTSAGYARFQDELGRRRLFHRRRASCTNDRGGEVTGLGRLQLVDLMPVEAAMRVEQIDLTWDAIEIVGPRRLERVQMLAVLAGAVGNDRSICALEKDPWKRPLLRRRQGPRNAGRPGGPVRVRPARRCYTTRPCGTATRSC